MSEFESSWAEDARQGAVADHCVILIPAPADHDVYECCRVVARQLQPMLSREQLWLEHEVPLSPGFSEKCMPAPIARLLGAAPSMIGRIRLEAGGLAVEYVRSGGYEPFRESYFDEVQLKVHGELELDDDKLREVVTTLCKCLHAAAVRGTPLFTNLTDELAAQPQRDRTADQGSRSRSIS